jgi:hypothetical protein
MRIACLILSWIFWIVPVLYWLFLTIISFVPSLFPTGSPKTPPSAMFFYTGIAMIGIAFVLWFFRKVIWFDPKRSVGIGYLLYLIPLYAFVLAAVVSPYFELVLYSKTSGLFFRMGFVVTGILLVCVFPRLPKKPQLC